jgi:alginate O-acetyltransferase complex protein AlgI
MTMERLFLDRWTKNIPNAIKVLFTLFLVMLSRVLFRANDLPHALSYYKQMFASTAPQMPKLWGYLTSPYEITMLFLAYLICLYPLIPGWQKVSDSVIQKFSDNSKELVRAFTWTFLLILSVVALAGRDFSPFIYFQF